MAPSGVKVAIKALLVSALGGTLSCPPKDPVPEKNAGQYDTIIEVVNSGMNPLYKTIEDVTKPKYRVNLIINNRVSGNAPPIAR